MARKALSPGTAKPRQIATILEQEIRSGRLGYGERLESESALVQRFSVSRETVRRGLEKLSSRGLITKRVGIGSFVTYDGRQMDDALGWSRALSKAGAHIETSILRLEIVQDHDLSNRLKIENPAFVALDRVRMSLADGHGISLERSRIPVTPEVAELPLTGLREGSLNKTLFAAGLVAAKGEEWADLELLSDEDARLLKALPKSPFLRTQRVVRTNDGQIIEYVTSLLNPAHFALHLEF
ncbi:MAG: GntR family transcriptional regulator [Mesorhizobium sp.]